MSRIAIRETTASGEVLNTYIATPTRKDLTVQDASRSENLSESGRIDIIPAAADASDRPSSLTKTWTRKLLEPFLPVGFPDSVSPDYTSYQIYDSFQALFSTTASLLASRAVLTTLGVGSSSASTTFAMYLSILQSTLSNLTSILFAHRFSTAISQHVKFYRFFADIVNDIAFVLDVLSPSLPEWGRVPALCAASCCRALCGVTGGASKAVLSGHFAKGGNVGELAAKDGSQEVLVNLVGMWIGGAVVGRVEGSATTWGMLVLLLAGHLWCNWLAVASVRLRTLGGERTAMVVEGLMSNDERRVTVAEVGRHERILRGRRSGGSNVELRSAAGPVGICRFGSIADLLDCAGWNSQAGGRAYTGNMAWLQTLLEIFEHENYLLWWYGEGGARCFVVVMKFGGGEEVACQVKAMCHAWRIANSVDQGDEKSVATTDVAHSSLATINADWQRLLKMVRAGGWDLEASRPVADSGSRIEASKAAAV